MRGGESEGEHVCIGDEVLSSAEVQERAEKRSAHY